MSVKYALTDKLSTGCGKKVFPY